MGALKTTDYWSSRTSRMRLLYSRWSKSRLLRLPSLLTIVRISLRGRLKGLMSVKHAETPALSEGEACKDLVYGERTLGVINWLSRRS